MDEHSTEEQMARQRIRAAIDSYNHGVVSSQQDKLDEAIGSYRRAIELKPDFAEAHNNLGDLLSSKGRVDEALECFLKTVALKPGSVHAHNNLGNILTKLGRMNEALASFDKALSLDPNCADVYKNRGLTLQHLKRYDEALASFDRAILINPVLADAYVNKAILKLLLGKYEEGWPLYEWRWQGEKQKRYVRNFSQPVWLGDRPITGKTVLLHGEQGLGDVMQFVRYAPRVAALGAKLVLEVPPSLIALIKTLKGDFTLIAKGDAIPAFDLHCPLMSLPLAFKTTLATIPADVPYLAADPHKQSTWRKRLGPSVRSRIGLVWSGNAEYTQDHNRSIGLRGFEPLLRLDFEFHSLQKDLRTEDHAILSEYRQIKRHETELHDFSETAALIAELDVVITIDTSVAHLAGALGKKVWILLPYSPDFRWLVDGSDSLWYPTARLFRQHSGGNWGQVMDDVCVALQA